jgi:hypothetical protein
VAQVRHWNLSLVDVLMQDMNGSTADLLRGADRMVQELAGEDRRNWENRARNQAMRVMHVASEAYEALVRGRARIGTPGVLQDSRSGEVVRVVHKDAAGGQAETAGHRH